MQSPGEPRRRRSLTVIDGAMSMILVLLVLQMWLLTATLESYLAGHRGVATPAAILSGILFLGCLGLYGFVHGADRAAR
jgi:hypothetical protein